jgi:hypothetical protein
VKLMVFVLFLGAKLWEDEAHEFASGDAGLEVDPVLYIRGHL